MTLDSSTRRRCAPPAATIQARSGVCTWASPTGSSVRSRATSRPGSSRNPRRTPPYDLAATIVKVLHSNAFTYDTDVSGLNCAGISTVECFAQYKRGFCQYYAATMAVILRDLGVPTRIAQGFLPGSRDLQTGTGADLQQQRSRLGRGLLPEHRLGHVRSDRRWRRPGRPPAVRPSGGQRLDQLVISPVSAESAAGSRTRRCDRLDGWIRGTERFARPARGGRFPSPHHHGGRGLRRLAARTARRHLGRRGVWDGHPAGRADSGSGRARRRPSTSSLVRSARSCRNHVRNSRRSPSPRSNRRMGSGPWAPTASRHFGRPNAGCDSACCGWPFATRTAHADSRCGGPVSRPGRRIRALPGTTLAHALRTTARRFGSVPRVRPGRRRRAARRGARSGCAPGGRAGPPAAPPR